MSNVIHIELFHAVISGERTITGTDEIEQCAGQAASSLWWHLCILHGGRSSKVSAGDLYGWRKVEQSMKQLPNVQESPRYPNYN